MHKKNPKQQKDFGRDYQEVKVVKVVVYSFFFVLGRKSFILTIKKIIYMKCIIIEDQPPAQRILKKYMEDMGYLQLKATFSDAIQAMEFLKTEEVDLVFLDIHLPKLSGIDFLKTVAHPPAVILTTAFSEYALESYEFNVVDYLLKPFSFQRFMKAVGKVPTKKIPEQVPPNSSQAINSKKELFIKSGYELIRVVTDDIMYIKSDADYTELFTSGKKYLSAEPLRYWLENLDHDQFVRVHKSFIINTFKCEKIVGNQIYLQGNIIIPIGRTYKEGVIQRYLR